MATETKLTYHIVFNIPDIMYRTDHPNLSMKGGSPIFIKTVLSIMNYNH